MPSRYHDIERSTDLGRLIHESLLTSSQVTPHRQYPIASLPSKEGQAFSLSRRLQSDENAAVAVINCSDPSRDHKAVRT